MTLRERLANWISGGALEKLKQINSENSLLWQISQVATEAATECHNMAVDRGNALRTIAAMETPSANATVRRMAKVAREALE